MARRRTSRTKAAEAVDPSEAELKARAVQMQAEFEANAEAEATSDEAIDARHQAALAWRAADEAKAEAAATADEAEATADEAPEAPEAPADEDVSEIVSQASRDELRVYIAEWQARLESDIAEAKPSTESYIQFLRDSIFQAEAELAIREESEAAATADEAEASPLKRGVADAEQAARTAKVEASQARKAHVAAKKAKGSDEDSILAEARANQAVVDADKAHDKAVKAVESAKARYKKEVARQKEADAGTTKDAKFFASIKPRAKEISGQLDKAAVTEGKADDLRLSAAKVMVDVEAKFAEAKPKGVKFKDWMESNAVSNENVKGRSWENLRKLLVVGKADDPAMALEDLRAANAAANKRARARASEGEASEASESSNSSTRNRTDASLSPVQAVQLIVNSLVDAQNIDVLLEISNIIAAAIESYNIPSDVLPVGEEVEEEYYDGEEDRAAAAQFVSEGEYQE